MSNFQQRFKEKYNIDAFKFTEENSTDGQANDLHLMQEGYQKNIFSCSMGTPISERSMKLKQKNHSYSGSDANNNHKASESDEDPKELEVLPHFQIESKIMQASELVKNNSKINQHQRPPLHAKTHKNFQSFHQNEGNYFTDNTHKSDVSPILPNEVSQSQQKTLIIAPRIFSSARKDENLNLISERNAPEECSRSVIDGDVPEVYFHREKKPSQSQIGSKRNSSVQLDKMNKSYLRRIVMEDDILETNEDKIDFLIGEIEVANTKISKLMDIINNQENASVGSNQSKRSQSRDKRKERLARTLDSELRIHQKDSFRVQKASQDSLKEAKKMITEPMTPKIPDDLYQYKIQIENLTRENKHLKEIIKKRTEDANETIIKLAKMKKEAEAQNMEYLKTIQMLVQNQKTLQLQVENRSKSGPKQSKSHQKLSMELKAAHDRLKILQKEKISVEKEYSKALEINQQLSEIIRFRTAK
ncbi:unnamed protein product [Moneuplotes crassus]|uniref:Uncharacterized protein n=1 Tax=Euplotes crassus TaxID=5936 RepID=A0AAD1XC86_EUPCR|nr:unnamed protein product [Moneuplotes crassus]